MKSSKLKLRKLLRSLEKVKGRHTELVSVYVPKGYKLVSIINQLQQEKATAENIKSKSTRKAVLSALDTIVNHLRTYKKTPKNGLAVFCGNVSKREGEVDIKLWSVEPPKPITRKKYWCDKEFKLKFLKQILEVKKKYGLLVMDRREANVGILEGKRVEEIKKLTSEVPGKMKAGGQSARRFDRLTEQSARLFYKDIAEAMSQIFGKGKELEGVLVGGPGPSKREFVEEEHLKSSLQKKILGVLNISYTGKSGLEELVDRSAELLEKAEVTREKELMKKFLEKLGSTPSLVAYKKGKVKKALDYGAVETLLLSERLDIDLIEKLSKQAEQIGARAELISSDTEEGKQLWELGGIAAILRYKI